MGCTQWFLRLLSRNWFGLWFGGMRAWLCRVCVSHRFVSGTAGTRFGWVIVLGEKFVNEFSLDDLLAEADAKYPNLVVEGVKFLNPLQMNAGQRAVFRASVESLKELGSDDDEDIPDVDEDDDEGLDAIVTILISASDDEVKASALFDALGDRPAAILVLMDRYWSLNKVGEA